MANKLHQFLRKHTPRGDHGPRSISMAIEFIRPFLRVIRTGACPRASLKEVDTDYISNVLSAVLRLKRGSPPPAVVAVSLSDPLPKPPWMRVRAFQDDRICDAQKPARDALMSEIKSGDTEEIAVLLRNRYYKRILRSLGKRRFDRLHELILECIIKPIMPRLQASLGITEVDLSADDEEKISEAVRFCLGMNLVFLLGYTILDRVDEMCRFAPLVNVLASTLPLYRISDNDGAMYIVLCP